MLASMQPLRYAINLTLDGCCDHLEGVPSDEGHRYWADCIDRADALLFGRVTYRMMEEGWRHPVPPGTRPDWMEPFARIIGEKKKYVVSSTLREVDWNAELLKGDLRSAVEGLKQKPGRGIFVGGVTLPKALAAWDLIDEWEFVVHPRIAGHGPTLLDGLPKPVDLELVDRKEFQSGAIALRYVTRRA